MTVQTFGDVSRDSSNDPIGSVYSPETPNKDLTPMQGGPRKADSQGVTSAPAAICGTYLELSGLTAGTLNADLVPSTDVSSYKWFSLHITNNLVGTLTFQISNDNINWVSCQINNTTTGSSLTAVTNPTNAMYSGAVISRYIRVRCTAYTSGSASGALELYTSDAATNGTVVAQSGTWTVQPGNTQNTTPWLTQGPTANATQAANTAGNVVVKGSAGALWSAVVTTLGTAQLDIFDNVSTNSGTKLLSIPASAPIGSIYQFGGGARANNGIVSAGVANCPAVTFQYA